MARYGVMDAGPDLTTAAELGWTSLRLDVATKQPEVRALYETAG